jgi:23S rRNA (uracil1939-C5)-methyltransferase
VICVGEVRAGADQVLAFSEFMHPRLPAIADTLPAGLGRWLLNSGAPRRIVYVSCNPATLARDADVLVNQAGYHLRSAGAINMFPHTSHIESIAVFERKD